MKNRQGIVWAPVLIIIGAVIVAGFATYFLIQNSNSDESKNTNIVVVNQAINNTNTISNTNSATNTNQVANNNASVNTNTTVDVTQDWKTYTNSHYSASGDSYTIKYPKDWRVSDFDPQYVRIVPPNGDNANRETASLDMSIDFIVVPGTIPVKTITSPQDVIIGGKSAKEGVIEGIPHVFATQVNVNGGVLQFSWTKVNEFEAALKEMLNPVTFTSHTSGWKTYTNSTYHFSFQYPPTHNVNVSTTQYGTYSPQDITIDALNDFDLEVGPAGSTNSSILKVFEKTYNFGDLSTVVSIQDPVKVGTFSATHYCGIPV